MTQKTRWQKFRDRMIDFERGNGKYFDVNRTFTMDGLETLVNRMTDADVEHFKHTVIAPATETQVLAIPANIVENGCIYLGDALESLGSAEEIAGEMAPIFAAVCLGYERKMTLDAEERSELDRKIHSWGFEPKVVKKNAAPIPA